jgi:hypothetical protein
MRRCAVDVHHGAVPDLLWDDVRDLFNPAWMGALPDVVVTGTSLDDWQTVLDFIVSSGWQWEYSEDGVAMPLPPASDILSRSPADVATALRVRPVPDVEVIFRPASVDEIDFDIDLRELQGQAGVDVLCDLMTTIGRLLGKPVLMSAEGDTDHPVLGFNPEAGRMVRCH